MKYSLPFLISCLTKLQRSQVILIFISLSLGSCCKEPIHETPAACELEPEVGPCDAAFPRYYFDKEEGKCKEFIWGGCGGVVPFETMEECEECL